MKNNTTLLELDGQRYLINGKQLQQVDHGVAIASLIDEHDGLKVISDFGVSPETRYVHGDSRYAEQLLHRDLRETGEAIGSRKVIVHQAHKQDRFNSQLFFSVLNNTDFTGLMNTIEASSSSSLPFSFYQTYTRAINRYAGKGSDAFVFIHGGVIDVVITNQGRLEGFGSLAGLSIGAQHSESFLNTLVDLVMTQERLAKVKLDQIFLFELLAATDDDGAWKEKLSKRLGLDVHPVAKQELSLDGVSYTSSIVPLFKALSVGDSLLSPMDKIQHQSNHWLPAVAAVLLVLNGLLLWLYVDNKGQQALSQQQIATLEQNIAAQPPVEKVVAVDYKKYLSGVEGILTSSGHKNYQQFINELAEISDIGNVVTYDWVSIDYPQNLSDKDGLHIKLIGHIANGWESPLNAFDKLTGRFTGAGYVLKDSAIGTTDEGLDFAFVMELSGL